ncbi:conserved hypothetical protein [metagenome]|uniref:DUF1800 domain-containing protein n=1 Tax=metagenome TaxID=256318 RepID=A0A2P2CEK7_9ZZZZ
MSETKLQNRYAGKRLKDPAGRPTSKVDAPLTRGAAKTELLRSAPAPVALGARSRHFARRFSGGLTPTLATEIKAAGGGRDWFEKQLYPARIKDARGTKIDRWFPSLQQSPKQIFDGGVAWEVMADLSKWTMCRRIHSKHQLLEQMVDFWSNLLHVPLMDDSAYFYRLSYDTMIRTYALSSFTQLLQHSTTHPAMGLFLDNAVSTKDNPNENLGRELLELHTVGVDAGYSEKDVKASAKMLTGYRVDLYWPSFRAYYDPDVHYAGHLKIMGFDTAKAGNHNAHDGRRATKAYLKYLAHHPATARRLARRLCVKFVSDTPSAGLVNTVARAYLKHDTAIRPTLRAMVDHPEFATSAGEKVRTPAEDYVATVRSLGIQLSRPTDDWSFANAMYWQYRELGQAPYEWPAPNGFPYDNRSWSSAGRILSSIDTHRSVTAGWWPSADRHQAAWRSDAAWLPRLPATVDEVIIHIGRLVLGQPPSLQIRKGIAQVLGFTRGHHLTAEEASNNSWYLVDTIVTSLLDSPTHLHR